MYRDKQAAAAAAADAVVLATHAPIKEEKIHREMHPRMLDKKSESSPNLLRKKETRSQVIYHPPFSVCQNPFSW